MKGDDWQFEMLCNVAASEMLMLVGTLTASEGDSYSVSVERILTLRREILASAEAVLLRLMKFTRQHCFAFAAHLEKNGRYRVVAYVMHSAPVRANLPMRTGDYLPTGTTAAECTAIGFTARETGLYPIGNDWETEYLGVAPYPGQTTPRVLGISKSLNQESSGLSITIVRGDATQPRGAGHKIICQVVNDKATSWGGAFAGALRKKWPDAQRQFTGWASFRPNLALGNVHFADVGERTIIANLMHNMGTDIILSRGSGMELYKSLWLLATRARANGESVHMPRIGSGQAGGDWNIIQESIEQTIIFSGLAVTIYDLPNAVRSTQRQVELLDVRSKQDQFIYELTCQSSLS